MESITESLTAKQKARLHEVADLMLQIYNTLVRMRYLDASWIQPGPHDVTAQMPLYESLGLDPSIIYLSHILPYIEPSRREWLDFYDGGGFIDLRYPEHIEQARDPMGGDDPAERMRPWMTPLSVQGNHTSVILYDAKRHVIGIFDPIYGGSSDHNLREGAFYREDEDGTTTHFKSRDGVDIEISKEEWDRLSREQQEERERLEEELEEEEEGGEGEDGEEESDEDGEDDEEEEDENHWDEMDSRPAAKVLRDIIRWYHQLDELPGCGEMDSGWSEDPVKSLYQKHGWPGEDFDGEAFLIDKLRAEAMRKVHDQSNDPYEQVEICRSSLENHLEREPAKLAKLHEKVAAAKTLDEEW